MDNFDKEYKNRFEEGQSLEGIDSDALWADIETELDKDEPSGAADKPRFPFGWIALLLLLPLAFLFLKKSTSNTEEIVQQETILSDEIPANKFPKKSMEKARSESSKTKANSDKLVHGKVENSKDRAPIKNKENPIVIAKNSAVKNINKSGPQPAAKISPNAKKTTDTDVNNTSILLGENKVATKIKKPSSKSTKNDKANNQKAPTVAIAESATPKQTTTPSEDESTENALFVKENSVISSESRIDTSVLEQKESASEASSVAETSTGEQIEKNKNQTKESIENTVRHQTNDTTKTVAPALTAQNETQAIPTPDSPKNAEEVPIKIAREKRLSLGAFIGLTALQNQFNFETDKPTLASELNASHKPEFGYAAALQIRYAIKKNIEVSSGISFINIQNEFNYSTEWDTLLVHPNQPTGDLINGIATREVRHHNIFTALSIPLSIGYTKATKSYVYGLDAGIALNFMQQQKGKSLNRNNQIQVFDDSTVDLPYKTRFLSYRISPFVGLKATKNLQIRLQPSFSYQRNRSGFFGLGQRDYLLNVQLGVVQRF